MATTDVPLIREELERAGFCNVTIETRRAQSGAPSARYAALAYCQGTPLRNEIEARGADKLQAATDYAAAAIDTTFGR